MIITSIDKLPPALAASISPEEKKYIEAIQHDFPLAVTGHFASLALPEKDDPIRRQCIPDPREALPDPFALDDPLGASRYEAAPGLIHQYADRALLLAARTCAGNCRHCFRRAWLGDSHLLESNFKITKKGDCHLFRYLSTHTEIKELLVSGGDPLTLSNAALSNLLIKLREARPDILLRLCTRVPITEPSRLDSETIALIEKFRPMRVVVHINHQRELSPESRAALGSCVEAGIPVYVQTVLMRGINDDAALLAGLFRDCLDLGLSPYYLFQMDLAPGTAHFRVPLKQGLSIYRELSGLISGQGLRRLPAYAVDLPGGGGKIRLHDNVIAGEKMTDKGLVYILKDRSGGEWQYPQV